MKALVILALFIFSSIFWIIDANSLPLNQFNALESLYVSAEGYNWEWSSPYSEYGIPWNFVELNYSNPCSESYPWQGVICNSTCQESDCAVISIDLEEYQLAGSIPLEFYNLTTLQTLNLKLNDLNGTLSNLIAKMSQLVYLDVSFNSLTGTIPSEIVTLTNLISLFLNDNQLKGSIPEDIGNLSQLETFYINGRLITGTIPNSFGNLTYLNYMIFDYVSVSGTIPEGLTNCIFMKELVLSSYFLSGTIPSNIGNMNQLTNLLISGELISGSLPESLSNLTELVALAIYTASITGTIPSSLSQLKSLMTLYLFQNKLTGTIPGSLGNLSYMEDLELQENLLTGTIPSSFGNFMNLEYLFLFENHLTGSLPSELFQGKVNFAEIMINNNSLSGAIPPEISDCVLLTSIFFHQNNFSGSIPEEFYNLTNLYYISLAQNRFVGTISPEIVNSPFVSYIDFSSNSLTGSLPDSLHEYEYIYFLDFSNNQLSGTLPDSLSTIRTLEYFSISNNNFHGSLPTNIGREVLEVLYIANNSFSGTFPPTLFLSPYLQSMVASLNCFSGTIPETICLYQGLVQLVLDGLHSSSKCSKSFFSIDKNSGYSISNGVHGTIPSCLFQNNKLKVLHLSGNNFHGSISISGDNLNMTSLILSNNMLKGTIPRQIWKGNIAFLDISFNQFTSEIHEISPHMDPFYTNNSEIEMIYAAIPLARVEFEYGQYLQVNRFSGEIPQSFLNSSIPLNILEGNLMACDYSKSNLPSQDPNYSSYQCGSDFTNISFYAWLCVLVFVVLLLSFSYGKNRSKRIFSSIFTMYYHFKSLYSENENSGPKDNSIEDGRMLDISALIEVNRAYSHFLHLLTKVLTWTLFVILPSYIILTFFYGVYSYQYAWTFSAAYLDDEVAAALLLCLYSILMVIVVYDLFYIGRKQVGVRMRVLGISWIENISCLFEKCIQKSPTSDSQKCSEVKKDTSSISSTNETETNSTSTKQKFEHSFWVNCKIILLIIMNIVIVLLVNIGYVSAINQNYTNTQLTFIFLSITMFKLVWSNVFLLGIGRRTAEHFFGVKIKTITIILISIFNNIIAPYVAEGFVSPNCFLYAITLPPSITSHYFEFVCFPTTHCQYSQCFTSIVCPFEREILFENFRSSFIYYPPFHYTYTCSSSLVSAFSYVFVYRYLITGLLEPLFFGLVKYFQLHNEIVANFMNPQIFFQYMTRFLPTLAKYENSFDLQGFTPSISSEPTDQTIISTENHLEKILYTLNAIKADITTGVDIGERVIVRLITDFAMLLSFGVIFPPLAVIISFSIIKDLLIVQLSIGRLLYDISKVSNEENHYQESTISTISHSKPSQILYEKLHHVLLLLNQQFQPFHRRLWQGIWWSCLVSVCFWSFTLFDTLGNQVGSVQAIWIIIIIVLCPFWSLGLVNFSVDRLFIVLTLRNEEKEEVHIPRETELSIRPSKLPDIQLFTQENPLQKNVILTEKSHC